MNLEDILIKSAEAGSDLESYVNSMKNQEPETQGIDDDTAELLAELSQDENISDDELEMIGLAAEQLGPEFQDWLENYLNEKDMGGEYDESQGPEVLYGAPSAEDGSEYEG